MTAAAAWYGGSSTLLAQICERLGVPRPERGHWEKKKAGKAKTQPSLPEVQPGDLLKRSREGSRHGPRPLPRPLEPRPPAPASTGPERPTSARRRGPHPLVSAAEAVFQAGRVTAAGYLQPTKRMVVDVYASRSGIKRALDTAGALLLELEGRGHRVVLAPLELRLHRPEVGNADARAVARRATRGSARADPVSLALLKDILSMGLLMDAIADRYRQKPRLTEELFAPDLAPLKALCRWTEGYWDLGPGQKRKWNEIQNNSSDIDLLSRYLLENYKDFVWSGTSRGERRARGLQTSA